MYANYHNHTWRCNHAVGTEREYVERAIEAGLSIFGFSDHTPQPYPNGHVCQSKMRLNQLEGYVDVVMRLKEEYREDIQIHLGLEVEYYPALFDELLHITSQYPFEYFLLGQHYLHNEYDTDGMFSGKLTSSEERLAVYTDQCIEAMETGMFSYIAHPDILNYVGDETVYERYVRRFCRRAKEENIPLEINMLGIRTNRHYPNPAFWKIAGEIGNTVMFGTDAHRPEDVPDLASVPKAQRIADQNGLQVLQELPMRRPVRA